MSKIDDARALVATALDGARAPAERAAALEAAGEARRALKVGWTKIGAPDGFDAEALAAELALSSEPPVEPEPKATRGGIGRLVNELLVDTDLAYAEIVARVREAFPEARTTARSVASVAADLRRDGVAVATRRRAKVQKAA